MNKYIEEITTSVQVYPTLSASGISGSAMVDCANYRNVITKCFVHKLPDQKGEGVATVSLYEGTVSTIGVATYLTASAVTGTLTSASNLILRGEIRTSEMSVNSGKRYVYAVVALPTGAYITAEVERTRPRYEKQ
jgi:hypothetical protein